MTRQDLLKFGIFLDQESGGMLGNAFLQAATDKYLDNNTNPNTAGVPIAFGVIWELWFSAFCQKYTLPGKLEEWKKLWEQTNPKLIDCRQLVMAKVNVMSTADYINQGRFMSGFITSLALNRKRDEHVMEWESAFGALPPDFTAYENDSDHET